MDRRKFVSNLSKATIIAPFTSLYATENLSRHHLEIAKIISSQWKKKQHINILYPKGSLTNLLPIVKLFKDLTGVDVNLKEGSLDMISSEILIDNRVNKGPQAVDIALPATFSVPDLAESGVIADLSSFKQKYEHKNLSQNSYYERGNYYNDKFYGYQADGDTYLMFYNKTWLQDPAMNKKYEDLHGKKLALPNSWQELDQMIRFFHNPQEKKYGGSLYRNKNYMIWEYWIRLHARGILPANDNMTPNFDSDEGIDVLNDLIKTSKFLSPTVGSDGLFDNFKSFSKNNSFCNLGWGGTQKLLHHFNPDIRNHLIYSSPPGYKGQAMPFFNWGWNYVVSANSVKQELAYLFTLFASCPIVSSLAVEQAEGFFDPHRKEHYQNTKIQKIYGKDFLKIHEKALNNSIPDFYLQGQSRYFSILKEALYAANSGQISPKTALKKAATSWDKITDQLGRKKQISQWKKLKKSYPANIKKVLSIG